MDHIIWYGAHEIDRMIWSIWRFILERLLSTRKFPGCINLIEIHFVFGVRAKWIDRPYEMVHMIFPIWYGPFYMVDMTILRSLYDTVNISWKQYQFCQFNFMHFYKCRFGVWWTTDFQCYKSLIFVNYLFKIENVEDNVFNKQYFIFECFCWEL